MPEPYVTWPIVLQSEDVQLRDERERDIDLELIYNVLKKGIASICTVPTDIPISIISGCKTVFLWINVALVTSWFLIYLAMKKKSKQNREERTFDQSRFSRPETLSFKIVEETRIRGCVHPFCLQYLLTVYKEALKTVAVISRFWERWNFEEVKYTTFMKVCSQWGKRCRPCSVREETRACLGVVAAIVLCGWQENHRENIHGAYFCVILASVWIYPDFFWSRKQAAGTDCVVCFGWVPVAEEQCKKLRFCGVQTASAVYCLTSFAGRVVSWTIIKPVKNKEGRYSG